MSEYQFYEFQAIDRRLTEEEQEVIGSLSSRTYPTPTRAVFVYHYSGFRGDPVRILEEYFDAMLYLSSWGGRRLMFRFPLNSIDFQHIRRYTSGVNSLRLYESGAYAVLDMYPVGFEPEGGWMEGDGWLDILVSLRADIRNGDYRGLYLAWLWAIRAEQEYADFDPGQTEPPVPPGLNELSQSHRSLIEFFSIDEDLVTAAAANSAPPEPQPTEQLEESIQLLPAGEQRSFLAELLRQTPGLHARLVRRLLELSPSYSGPTANPPLRSVTDLFSEAEVARLRREDETRKKVAAAELEKAHRTRSREQELWREVYVLVDHKRARSYEFAVQHLKELKAAALHFGELEKFEQELTRLKDQYRRSSALLAQMRMAGLIR